MCLCSVNRGLTGPAFAAASVVVGVGALWHTCGGKFGLQRAVYDWLPEACAAFALALFERGVAAVEFIEQLGGLRGVVRALEKRHGRRRVRRGHNCAIVESRPQWAAQRSMKR